MKPFIQKDISVCWYRTRNIPKHIQRIIDRLDKDVKKGIDGLFIFDDMGCEGFESDKLRESLKLMVENKVYSSVPYAISSHDYESFVVGPYAQLNVIHKIFEDQLNNFSSRKVKLATATHLRESYSDDKWFGRYIGWWAVDAKPFPWVIFKKQNYALDWIQAVNEIVVEKNGRIRNKRCFSM